MPTIFKGCHYPFPFFFLTSPKWVKKDKPTSMTRCFRFTKSCLFDLKDEDQWDVNKLFGFSIGFHHNTSFRFGWRPLLETGQIEIVRYEYHNGVRQPTGRICPVDINKPYQFELTYFPCEQKTHYRIIEKGSLIEVREIRSLFKKPYLKKKYGLGYLLGIYFGGNETAPQKIKIKRCRKG